VLKPAPQFTLAATLAHVGNPKGDRVMITMSGKFLPQAA
jgi:cyanate lyase